MSRVREEVQEKPFDHIMHQQTVRKPLRDMHEHSAIATGGHPKRQEPTRVAGGQAFALGVDRFGLLGSQRAAVERFWPGSERTAGKR